MESRIAWVPGLRTRGRVSRYNGLVFRTLSGYSACFSYYLDSPGTMTTAVDTLSTGSESPVEDAEDTVEGPQYCGDSELPRVTQV